MAGYVIHLAVAEEYLRKHSNTEENYDEFINGVIAPDGVTDKSLTHYGEKSSKVRLKKYLEENELNTSYDKGYFLHLVTDYLFYSNYINFSKEIYNDYDILNKYLIEKYNVKLPEKVKNKVFFLTGETKVLDLKTAEKVIDEISDLDLLEVKNQVISGDKKWNINE